MKTKEELNALKEEVETVSRKLHELTEEELAQVSGGTEPGSGSGGGGYCPSPAGPSTPTTPGKPTECIVIPVKGEETDHITIEVR